MKINEENFLDQLKTKNEKALDYVIDTYGWIIKSVIKKHLYNLQSVQDECINDVLLGLWNNIDKFDENKSEFKNWIAGIAKFKAIDYKRKYLRELDNENVDDLNITVDDSINELLKNELSLEMQEMMNSLKEKDRELFYKLYVEEIEVDKVSQETGIKRDVIYNRVSRAKKKLRDIFKLKESERC
ncbi:MULTISPECIES: sigma-70 family RNA polymerase sigma factor [Clostridium]|jgi:RNA polymerase sigma-70 factor (ECF subfamily)|uniref:Sigma-70 family RNA polymerase sigma factor n=1 Tax=Clostridium butyricum TaxID=1492 RepID=A0A0Q0TKR9_CLOBU|nr:MULTISPECIES: sigma-70 family RNA polymerase sigma factor [Clostridium]ENZ29513.1 sigma-70 family RNA polymerase sigma factor [Clostridium butyricum 60E.3]KIU06326.1 RNA polymerase sigma-70 factor [Clostridium butyricum]KJZ88888.1 RNA polymerase sigma-70 factor [Clostridium sp. IBUN125C]KJZ92011.1 RNA polymerase sigma-70 factor [Clostridium sp. IBUN62F]KQB78403.1 RNA polymerase subunit sigma-70 [Clostridium butyricum]